MKDAKRPLPNTISCIVKEDSRARALNIRISFVNMLLLSNLKYNYQIKEGKVILRLVLLGPPGSGKGTYATRLSESLNIPPVSTGDLVRNEAKSLSDLGRKIKSYSEKGELVPDQIINDLIMEKLD